MKRKFILLPITLTALSPAISLVGCGGYTPEPKADVIIDLSVDASSSHDGPKTKTEPFFINTNKTYQFNIDAGICSSFEYATNESSFWINNEGTDIDVSIKSIKVKGKAFTPTLEREGTPGTYCYYVSRTRKNVYIYNYDITDITLTMSIILNFNENNGESVVAYWYGAS